MKDKVLSLDEIDLDVDWLSIGATSVDMIRIANRLEEELNYRPDFDQLYRQPTAIAVAEIIANELGLNTTLETESISNQYQVKYKVIKDPEERNQFKAQQLGLRDDIEGLSLSLTQPDSRQLESEYQQRRSIRQFSGEKISPEDFSKFMACLSQIKLDSQGKYLYPSAGGLYPVQVYLHIKPERIEGIEGGIYYYHPQKHHLIKLSNIVQLDSTIHERLVNRPIYEKSAFSIFLIAQMKAVEPMYGELARDFCVMEAGYMSQLMMMKSKEYNLGLCPIGTLKFEAIQDLFQLDEGHLLIHSLLGGKLAENEKTIYSHMSTHYNFDDLNELDTTLPMPTKLEDNREEIEI